MSESDLRERVAQALEATTWYAVEPDARANEMTPDEWGMLASAAIDIVLEEAARCAEGFPVRDHGALGIDSHAAAEQAADEIAAAIRALANGSGSAS